MTLSLRCRICMATLVAWWGLIFLLAPWSAAQVRDANQPEAEKPVGEGQAAEGDAEKKSTAELMGLRDKVKTLAAALATKRNDLIPRVREAQINMQQAAAALQKAIGPDDSKILEEELRVAQESLSLLEQELALAEEEITVAETMVTVAEKRAMLRVLMEEQGKEDDGKILTAQEARLATEEAEVAAERVSLAQGKVENLQTELHALEREVAESKVLITTLDQEIKSIAEQLSTHSGGEEKDQLERQLRRAKRRVEVLQKRTELTQWRLAVTRGKYDLAQREHELLAADMERLEAHAKTIRDTVGVSLDDIRAEQEQAMAAQRAAEAEKEKAQLQQAAAQQERHRAQQALERAKIAREQAKTPEQLRLAELTQLVAEKQADLAQKKTELAKEKIDVAERAAELAQKRLEVTSYKLEAGRRTLTATDVLNTYEWAKSEAAKASKQAQSAQAVAQLAGQETESLRREAELAELKTQVEKSQLERPTGDPIARATIRALEEGARVADDRAQVAEERAAVVQDRARLVTERAHLLREFEEQLAIQRSTYRLWKREPSKITWSALEEVSTDLALLRSSLIIGISTLPEQIRRLGSHLFDPAQFWTIFSQSLTVVLLFLLAIVSGLSLRRKLQPLIAGQENLFLPSVGAKLLRACTRLISYMALPGMLLVGTLLTLWLVAGDNRFFMTWAIAVAGYTAYSAVRGIVQELFMPWNPQQRLIACRNGIATYLYRHLRRLSAYVTIWLTGILMLQAVRYHDSVIALLYLPFYLGLLILLILLTSNKEAVLGLLPNPENRVEKFIYVAATQVYPLFVLLLICIVALQSVGYANLARFLLTSSLLTAVILTAAHVAGKGMDRVLRWWLLAEGRMEADFLFGRATAETFYTILSHAAGYFAYLIAIVMIAGTWGVDLSGIYATLTSPAAQDYGGRFLAALLVMIVSAVILRAAYFLIDKVFNVSPEEARAWRKRIALGDKGKTVAPLLKSVLKYCTIFVAAVLVLRTLGVDPTPIIAGAGVVGLAVGFGAQTLVKDVIAGFFLLFEGLIGVGDEISLGNSAGVVEEVGLRVTKYRTFSGELWVIPNGEIRAFGNSNRQWMRAVVAVGVAHEQDVGKAMRVLEEVGKAWAAERRGIVLEPPQVQGILAFDGATTTLRLAIKVKPSQQLAAEWELRRRIKEAFEREGVESPFARRLLATVPEADNPNGDQDDLLHLSKRMQKVEDPPKLVEPESAPSSPAGRSRE